MPKLKFTKKSQEPNPTMRDTTMPTEDLKDYLSLAELVARIPYKPQTIYNWIHAGVWQLGVHYYKPTPRKLIFHYPTIQRPLAFRVCISPPSSAFDSPPAAPTPAVPRQAAGAAWARGHRWRAGGVPVAGSGRQGGRSRQWKRPFDFPILCAGRSSPRRASKGWTRRRRTPGHLAGAGHGC
jgi:hypothetical protein